MSPRQNWSARPVPFMIAFIALLLIFTDFLWWLDLIGILVVLALIASGASMMRRRTGG